MTGSVVSLRSGSGQLTAVALTHLVSHADFEVLDQRRPPPAPVDSLVEALEPELRRRVRFLERHLLQVETGWLPDDEAIVDARYDIARTTVNERIEAKAAELAGSDHPVSIRQLYRFLVAYRHDGALGLVDRRVRERLLGRDPLAAADDRVLVALRKAMSAQTTGSTISRKTLVHPGPRRGGSAAWRGGAGAERSGVVPVGGAAGSGPAHVRGGDDQADHGQPPGPAVYLVGGASAGGAGADRHELRGRAVPVWRWGDPPRGVDDRRGSGDPQHPDRGGRAVHESGRRGRGAGPAAGPATVAAGLAGGVAAGAVGAAVRQVVEHRCPVRVGAGVAGDPARHPGLRPRIGVHGGDVPAGLPASGDFGATGPALHRDRQGDRGENVRVDQHAVLSAPARLCRVQRHDARQGPRQGRGVHRRAAAGPVRRMGGRGVAEPAARNPDHGCGGKAVRCHRTRSTRRWSPAAGMCRSSFRGRPPR